MVIYRGYHNKENVESERKKLEKIPRGAGSDWGRYRSMKERVRVEGERGGEGGRWRERRKEREEHNKERGT